MIRCTSPSSLKSYHGRHAHAREMLVGKSFWLAIEEYSVSERARAFLLAQQRNNTVGLLVTSYELTQSLSSHPTF